MAHFKRLLTLALVVSILIPCIPRRVTAQEDAVARLMAEMSSAAKVGQLFLVAFPGAKVTDDAAITELIRDYHVSGVILLPENGNIVNEGDTPTQIATLIGQLQDVAWAATEMVTETVGEEALPGPFIPLFIAVNHEGNGMPYTAIVSGTTLLPSEMALGATWNPAHAETVGQIAGQELRALGVNMLLGPSLDVLESPRPESTGDLGVRSFGGEPFWVGQMGLGYIRGVHEGGGGRVAVIAKYFPGLGSSDRSLNEEVPTVQRTMEKLKQVDLAPYFTVVQTEDLSARPDGVMVSHIRFRGLAGGRFVLTRPISVDSQVLQQLLALPELAGWRQGGGVTVSDSLGVRALRRFYDPSEASFNARRIAQEAFLAGNDLLVLSQFALGSDWDEQIANVESTIGFFRAKYESDPSFQAQVDAAVARILRLKLALYGGYFSLNAAKPSVTTLGERVGLSQGNLPAIARDAITLLSPPSPDLVPSPPTLEDNIVVFTGSRQGQPCATCAPVPYVDPRALQDTIVRLYGPRATGQVNPRRVSSFTFDQLETYLNAPPPTPTPTPAAEDEATPTPIPPDPVEVALQNADWIIFAMLSLSGDPPQSRAVQRFLAERADTLRHPYLIVLAYDAPYYLDATEISKLSAYYVAYSRTESFIEASVQALFGGFAPKGKSPVSVAGINYDLFTQTLPDPDQTITLYIGDQPESGATPTPPQLKVGDELKLRTSVIVDHNDHQVPDGTPIQFIFTYPQEGLERSATASTRGGVAETAVTLDRTGQLNVSLQSDPFPRTEALQITIQEGGSAIISTLTPEPPTPTPRPVPTSTAEPATPPAETPQPTPGPANGVGASAPMNAGGLDLLAALIGVLIVGGAVYYAVRRNYGSVSQALQLALWCVVGGLTLYLAYALRLPGATWLREQSGFLAAGWVALLGSAAPLVIVWVIAQRRRTAVESGLLQEGHQDSEDERHPSQR